MSSRVFNNLLMGVLGNARVLLEDLSSSSLMRKDVQNIETAAIRAAELTNQMLAYFGKGQFVMQRIDLSELVEEIGHLFGGFDFEKRCHQKQPDREVANH